MTDSSSTTPPPEAPEGSSEGTATQAPQKREKTAAQKAAAARKRARRMARMRPAEEVAELLFERFPEALIRESRERKPLAVGIHVALNEAVGDDFHKLEIQRFLANYAHSLGYLHAIADRRPRVALDGSPTGEEITEDMVRDARAEIDKIQEKRAARGDAPKRGPARKPGAGGPPKGKAGGGKPGGKPKRAGFLGLQKRGPKVSDSAETLKEEAIKQRNQRSAKIISKKSRRVPRVEEETLMARKLSDAGLGQNAPRKKLRLGRKDEDGGED